MRKDEPVLQSEMAVLPRWAQVAFAARCARRVQPIFTAAWPDAPDQPVAAVEQAIRQSEIAAAAAAAAAAARAAAAADAAVLAAAVAAKAAVIALVRLAMRADFNVLRTAARREKWGDRTPVPPEVFGELWPSGEPAEWTNLLQRLRERDGQPDASSTNDPQEVSPPAFDEVQPFTLLVDPGSATPDEIAELLVKFSKLYRMLGGSGINFAPTDVRQPAGELV